MKQNFPQNIFDESLFRPKRFVFFSAAEAPEPSAPTESETPTQGEQAEGQQPREQAEQPTAEQIRERTDQRLAGMRNDLQNLVKERSILSDAALRAVLIDEVAKLNEEIKKVLEGGVSEAKFTQLSNFVERQIATITGETPSRPAEAEGEETEEAEEAGEGGAEEAGAEEASEEANHLQSLITEFNKTEGHNTNVQAFITTLGTENMNWLKNNQENIDQAQFSKSIEGLFANNATNETATALASTLRTQIETARSALERSQQLAVNQSLEARSAALEIERADAKREVSKIDENNFKKWGPLAKLMASIYKILGVPKPAEKELTVKPKEKVSESNEQRMTTLRESYRTLKSKCDSKLPANFNQVFERVGKELNGDESKPLEEMLITEANLDFLTRSADNTLVAEFLDARATKFTAIMNKISSDIDGKKLFYNKENNILKTLDEVGGGLQYLHEQLKNKTPAVNEIASLMIAAKEAETSSGRDASQEFLKLCLGTIYEKLNVDMSGYDVQDISADSGWLKVNYKKTGDEGDHHFALEISTEEVSNAKLYIRKEYETLPVLNDATPPAEINGIIEFTDMPSLKSNADKLKRFLDAKKTADEAREQKERVAVKGLIDKAIAATLPATIETVLNNNEDTKITLDALSKLNKNINISKDYFINKTTDGVLYLVSPKSDSDCKIYKIGAIGDQAYIQEDDMKAENADLEGTESFIKKRIDQFYDKQNGLEVVPWRTITAQGEYKDNELTALKGGKNSDAKVYALWKEGNPYSDWDLEGYIVVKPNGMAELYDYDSASPDDLIDTFYLPTVSSPKAFKEG